MHLFVYIQYSILFGPSLLFLSMSDDTLSMSSSLLHWQTTYVFLSGTGHSSLNRDKIHTTNPPYTNLHNLNSMYRRLYLLLKICVHCEMPVNFLKI